jgi:hypothetical protein
MQSNMWNILTNQHTAHSKLWSFGCSHAAGSELGSGQTSEQIQAWFTQHTGYDNWFDGMSSVKLSVIEYEKLFMTWFNKHNRPENPLLSYAGHLAALTNLQLVSHAISGCGIDRAFNEFLSVSQSIDWNNDLVLFECPPFDRYMLNDNDKFSNLQLCLVDNVVAMDYVPSASTIEYLYVGILQYIRSVFPKVHFISIQNFVHSSQMIYEYSTSFVHDYFTDNKIYLNDSSMLNFACDTIGKHCRMPGSHFNEATHAAFAKYLHNCLM